MSGYVAVLPFNLDVRVHTSAAEATCAPVYGLRSAASCSGKVAERMGKIRRVLGFPLREY